MMFVIRRSLFLYAIKVVVTTFLQQFVFVIVVAVVVVVLCE